MDNGRRSDEVFGGLQAQNGDTENMSEINFVSCPICKGKMLVAWDGNLFSDARIQEKIEKHANSHTIGEIREFIGLNLAEQVNELEKKWEGMKKEGKV